MALIVQKYGGSSLHDANAIQNVARRIAYTQNQGNRVVATVSAMGNTTDKLIELARSVSIEPHPRELDILLSTGELVSCTLVAMGLRSIGLNAISLSGAQAGIHTNDRFGNAKIESVEPSRIIQDLDNGNIVIVAGFQGITDNMNVTTLGRGASDITAVALAAALNADQCEIYTDVAGIYTADPKLVPKAQQLKEVGFEEMLELASYGAKMAPRSIELGMVYDIPILVASSLDDKPGTLIHRGAEMDKCIGEIRNRVRGVATDANVTKITLLGIPNRPGSEADVFEPLADADISVDVIVQGTVVDGHTDLTFTIKGTDKERAMVIMTKLSQKIGARGVIAADGLAKVSIVGSGMQDAPGYASRMFRALADAGINIDVITTSEIRITCVIDECNAKNATQAIHSAFLVESAE